jgi:hypothetical protein
MLNLSLSKGSLSLLFVCLCTHLNNRTKIPPKRKWFMNGGGINRKRSFPLLLLVFPFFFFHPKSPIIYLSLFSFSLCVYLYIDIHTHRVHIWKKKKVSNPPCVVPYRISSISKCSRTRQNEAERKKDVCFSVCGEPMGFMFLLLLLVVVVLDAHCCFSVRVGTGVDGYHHLGFSLAFHSRSVARSICGAQEPAHTHKHSTTSKSIICNYLYFKNEQGNNM